MDAGKLRHRVTIERFTQGAQDPNTGDIINQWQVLRVVWASFEPVSGREFIAASAATRGCGLKQTPARQGVLTAARQPPRAAVD